MDGTWDATTTAAAATASAAAADAAADAARTLHQRSSGELLATATRPLDAADFLLATGTAADAAAAASGVESSSGSGLPVGLAADAAGSLATQPLPGTAAPPSHQQPHHLQPHLLQPQRFQPKPHDQSHPDALGSLAGLTFGTPATSFPSLANVAAGAGGGTAPVTADDLPAFGTAQLGMGVAITRQGSAGSTDSGRFPGTPPQQEDILLDPQALAAIHDPFATAAASAAGTGNDPHDLLHPKPLARTASTGSAMNADLQTPTGLLGSPLRPMIPLSSQASNASFAEFTSFATAPQSTNHLAPTGSASGAPDMSLSSSNPGIGMGSSTASLPAAFAPSSSKAQRTSVTPSDDAIPFTNASTSAALDFLTSTADQSATRPPAPPLAMSASASSTLASGKPLSPNRFSFGAAPASSAKSPGSAKEQQRPLSMPAVSSSTPSKFSPTRSAFGAPEAMPGSRSGGIAGAGAGGNPLISPLIEEKDLAQSQHSHHHHHSQSLSGDSTLSVSGMLAAPLSASLAPRTRLNALPPPLEPHMFTLPTRKWTDPTSFVEVPYIDRLGDAIARGFANIPELRRPSRHIMTLDQAVGMDDPYKALVQAHSWRSLAQLARCDIISSHPADVDKLSRLWLLRWYALSRLQFFDHIQTEMDRVGELETPELVFERRPDVWPNRRGPLASFELRLFCNLVPAMKGNHYESIRRMYKLLYSYRKQVQHAQTRTAHHQQHQPQAAEQMPGDHHDGQGDRATVASPTMSDWKTTQAVVLMHVANLLAQAQDFPGAASILDQLWAIRPADDMDFLAALGRVYLQIGDLPLAKKTFLRIEQHLGLPIDESKQTFVSGTGSKSMPAIVKSVILTPLPQTDLPRPDLVLSHRGFLHMAEGEFEAGAACFMDLLSRLPTYTAAVNNLAICHLYMGNVGQAASFLESLMGESPKTAGVSEDLVFNLCTMYDLTEHSLDKKRKLLANVVSLNAGDDFSAEMLKL